MAKQVGPLFFTGTVDGVIFYKLGDHYYMRAKGDYKSGKQMRKDPHYKRTLQQADRFGGASKLVKEVYYRELPRAVRKHGLFGKLTGLVNRWLYAGKAEAEVKALLIAHCQTLAAAATATPAKPAGLEPQATATQPNSTNQPTSNTDQRPTLNVAPTTRNAQQTTLTAQRPSKPPRYLSRWKVKRNGRLHIPRSANPLPTEIPLCCHAELVSASAVGNKDQTTHRKAIVPLPARQRKGRHSS